MCFFSISLFYSKLLSLDIFIQKQQFVFMDPVMYINLQKAS